MKLKTVVLLSISGLILAGSASCRKIQEAQILKGIWKLQGVYIDTFSENQMLNFLPYYPDGNGCCEYKINFDEDDIVVGYYLTHDTFNYVVTGTWNLMEYNKIYINLDRYVDGVFTIKKKAGRKYEMTSDLNHIRAFDGISPALDTTFMKLNVERQ